MDKFIEEMKKNTIISDPRLAGDFLRMFIKIELSQILECLDAGNYEEAREWVFFTAKSFGIDLEKTGDNFTWK